MPLDSHGFADLKASMRHHEAVTFDMPFEDPRKFMSGTQAQLTSNMERVFSVCPSGDRILQDIQRYPHALSEIYKADGCLVPDLNFRNGRRGASAGALMRPTQAPRLGRPIKKKGAASIAAILHPGAKAAVADTEALWFSDSD